MKLEKTYRILSAILMPIIFILAFFGMLFLMAAFSNPAFLFAAFVLICVTIYMVKSTQFYRRNIEPGIPARANVRDWIRVNGFVAIFFVLQIVASAVYLLAMKKQVMANFQVLLNQIQDMQPGAASSYSPEALYASMKNIMIFFMIFDVLLAAHIVCTFKLLKKYRNLLLQP